MSERLNPANVYAVEVRGPMQSGGWHIRTTFTEARDSVLGAHQNGCSGRMVSVASLLETNAELLEALERLEARARALDQSATHDGLTNCDALRAARAAIAKAKGSA